MFSNFYQITLTSAAYYDILDSDPLHLKAETMFDYIGIHHTDSWGRYAYGSVLDSSDSVLKLIGVVDNFTLDKYSLRVNLTATGSDQSGGGNYGIWLLSEGGTTLTSIAKPNINTPAN